jgi:23S rRNA U2552 (ribose-2'-O)-methylase RlmE/FtsJ
LIQINRKFNILEKVNSLLDLCCAPGNKRIFKGSWLQVVHKLKTNKILLMGIDIVPIKKIKDVKFYKKNILLLKTIKNLKDRWKIINIEVILNDGSPNTGVSKILDTINQVR